ncbi:hypothetical protein BRADI_2g22825v3 [Brachypodium distachyon]|uniref:Uncharacterized protein n=1 Tax=Brachypodium distachyon TaxID=15368 RepID=A0A0Q3QXF1_BRADI|nr:hypothetical protein BRADI_2g22825v3 [Brachypodium distachyon]
MGVLAWWSWRRSVHGRSWRRSGHGRSWRSWWRLKSRRWPESWHRRGMQRRHQGAPPLLPHLQLHPHARTPRRRDGDGRGVDAVRGRGIWAPEAHGRRIPGRQRSADSAKARLGRKMGTERAARGLRQSQHTLGTDAST